MDSRQLLLIDDGELTAEEEYCMTATKNVKI